MFDILIFNLDMGSYLRMTPGKGSCKGGELKEGLVLSGLPGAYKDFYSGSLLYGRNTWSRVLSRTKEVSHTTQLQAQAGILRNVWLFEGEVVTSNSEV